MASHEGEESSVFSARRIKLLPDLEEVVVDESYDVEPIGDDLGIREETPRDTAVSFREVHDDHSDLELVKKPLERTLERKLGSSEEDIMDPVFGEVAEGSGVSFFSGEEVLVDSEDSWAWIVFHLREFVLQEVVIATFDGGLSDGELF